MLPKMRSPFVASLIMVAVTAGSGCVPTPTSGKDLQGDASVPHSAPASEATTTPDAMPDRGGTSDALHTVASEAEFHQIIAASDKPVLVYFSAAWCKPCRVTTPYMEELALEETHRVRVVGVDVDHMARIIGQHRVLSMPTVILFKRGQEVGRIADVKPKRQYSAFLDSWLR